MFIIPVDLFFLFLQESAMAQTNNKLIVIPPGVVVKDVPGLKDIKTQQDFIKWAEKEENKKYVTNEYFSAIDSTDGMKLYKITDSDYKGYTNDSFYHWITAKHPTFASKLNYGNFSMFKLGVYNDVVSNSHTEIMKKGYELLQQYDELKIVPNDENAKKLAEDMMSDIVISIADGLTSLTEEERQIAYKEIYDACANQVNLMQAKLRASGYPEESPEDANSDTNKKDSKDTNKKTEDKVKGSSGNSGDYTNTYVSYSGTDIVVTAQLCIDNKSTGNIMTMGSLQTLSYSVYDRMEPIHSLGNINAKDYVHTHRYIAGSMVFAVFDEHWAKRFLEEYRKANNIPSSEKILTDEMPPLNLTISMGNEYGSASRFVLYGVRFFNEGMTVSVNDIYTEHTYQYVALNIDYLENLRNPGESAAKKSTPKQQDDQKTQEQQPNDGGSPQQEEQNNKHEEKPKDDKLRMNTESSEDIIEKTKDAGDTLSKQKKAALKRLDENYEAEYGAKKALYETQVGIGEMTKEEMQSALKDIKNKKKEMKREIEDYFNNKQIEEKNSPPEGASDEELKELERLHDEWQQSIKNLAKFQYDNRYNGPDKNKYAGKSFDDQMDALKRDGKITTEVYNEYKDLKKKREDAKKAYTDYRKKVYKKVKSSSK